MGFEKFLEVPAKTIVHDRLGRFFCHAFSKDKS